MLFSTIFLPVSFVICFLFLLNTFPDFTSVELTSVKKINGNNILLFRSLLLLASLISLTGIIVFFKQTRKTSIDLLNHTITLKYYFLKKEIVLDIKKLTGYYNSIKRSTTSFNSFEVLILMNNDIVVATISSSFYSNYSEMKNSLSEIPYLGILKYNLMDKINWIKGKSINKA
jgi:hypothetical protein